MPIEESLAEAERRIAELLRLNEAQELRLQKAAEDLRRVNQTLRMVSECDRAMVQVTEEQALVQSVCSILQETGGYMMVWVGYARHDDPPVVQPVASAGFEDGYLSRITIAWSDTEMGRGPTGTAIRTGKPSIGKDFLTDPRLAPWREEAMHRGFRSSIALPLNGEGSPFGALTLYAASPEAFGPGEIELLGDLADDLAFGIMAIRARIERDHAYRSLEKRTTQLRVMAVELAQAEERERRRLAQILHDELQQLLAGARYGLESLREAIKTKAHLATIARVDSMLGESMDVTRTLAAELSPPVLSEAGLGPALKWLAGWCKKKHGLSVELDIEEPAAVLEEDVRIMLFQATRELLFNIVKHAGVKTARVRVARDGRGALLLTVHDEGGGFDPGPVLARDGAVGGYGLYRIRERLELLGGNLSIESSARGSGLSLSVPLRRASEGKGEKERIRVVLADDHEIIREGLLRLLQERPDLTVVGTAASGEEAVSKAISLEPDVVVMDIELPGIGGIEATRRIKAARPRVRVIGLSLYVEPVRTDELIQAGAEACLDKAGPSENLVAALRGRGEGRPAG
jgi:signal transduction histidine kinase/CheY-like chemotaxis protein